SGSPRLHGRDLDRALQLRYADRVSSSLPADGCLGFGKLALQFTDGARVLVVEGASELLQSLYRFLAGASLRQAREGQTEEIDRRRNLFGETMTESSLRLRQGEHCRQLAIDQQAAQQQDSSFGRGTRSQQLLVVARL